MSQGTHQSTKKIAKALLRCVENAKCKLCIWFNDLSATIGLHDFVLAASVVEGEPLH